MKILVVGAGSIGGYFGGRLLEAGRNVTFLVRPHRAEVLAKNGLVIKSPSGNSSIPNPPTVTANHLEESYDLIILSCKAYDLENAIDDFAPAVGPTTRILPLLNGMRHMDILDQRFGIEHVLGGLCMIATSLNADSEIVHSGDLQSLTFGARDTGSNEFAGKVEKLITGAGFTVTHSDQIVQEMWEKWVFIATSAGLTTLMRATIGDIVEAGGADIAESMLRECGAIAGGCGFPPRDEVMVKFRTMFTATGSPLTASLFRDLEKGGRIESDQQVGDLLARSTDQHTAVLLRVAYVHMKTYEARSQRMAANG